MKKKSSEKFFLLCVTCENVRLALCNSSTVFHRTRSKAVRAIEMTPRSETLISSGGSGWDASVKDILTSVKDIL